MQAIPEIAQQAKHLTVFQRTPTFCVPARNGRVDPDVTKARKADYDGIRQRTKNSFFGFDMNFIPKSVLEVTPEEREREFDRMWDSGGFAFWLANYLDMFFSKEANDIIADYLKRKIRSTVNDPAVADKLTPKNYPYGTSCASCVASMIASLFRRMWAMHSVIHSTCCSIDTGMFDSTEGLCGPVIMNRLG